MNFLILLVVASGLVCVQSACSASAHGDRSNKVATSQSANTSFCELVLDAKVNCTDNSTCIQAETFCSANTGMCTCLAYGICSSPSGIPIRRPSNGYQFSCFIADLHKSCGFSFDCSGSMGCSAGKCVRMWPSSRYFFKPAKFSLFFFYLRLLEVKSAGSRNKSGMTLAMTLVAAIGLVFMWTSKTSAFSFAQKHL